MALSLYMLCSLARIYVKYTQIREMKNVLELLYFYWSAKIVYLYTK